MTSFFILFTRHFHTNPQVYNKFNKHNSHTKTTHTKPTPRNENKNKFCKKFCAISKKQTKFTNSQRKRKLLLKFSNKKMKTNVKVNSTYDTSYYHSFHIVITSPKYFNFTTIMVQIKYYKKSTSSLQLSWNDSTIIHKAPTS